MSATVRFSQLVSASGKPQLHTLWAAPESDREFQRAVKAGRVLTLHQENVGSKKDYGVVGFSKDGPAQYLIFPRSLKAFHGQPVVGIKYDVFDPPSDPKKNTVSESRLVAKKDAQAVTERPSAAPSEGRSKKPEELKKHGKMSPEPEDRVEEAASAPPEDGKEPQGKQRTARQHGETVSVKPELDRPSVLKEIKSALKELEAGKAVVVFRRLEKLARILEYGG